MTFFMIHMHYTFPIRYDYINAKRT